jgi:hypothetical protein
MNERTRYQQLQPEDRMTMASMHQQGASMRAMARVLGRSTSTISREFGRNTLVLRKYSIRLVSCQLEVHGRTLRHHERMASLLAIVGRLVQDAFRWMLLLFRSKESIRAENLLLRRQLALYLERGVRPRRIDLATRVSLAVLARLFDWRGALVVVQSQTMIRWHRAGWRLLWRLKSRPGRPLIPKLVANRQDECVGHYDLIHRPLRILGRMVCAG